tara:strand:+ start:100 stop:972 length:873 start_codon:yes stop_codon:yes gene_type:complete
MKILITGTGTMIGNAISVHLLKKKLQLICTYNSTYPKNLKNKVKLIKLNLNNVKDIKNITFDAIIHCAAVIPGYSKITGKKLYNTNVKSFRSILDSSKKIKKIVLLSTMSIYGIINKSKISEKDFPNNPDYYGSSKYRMEKDLKKFSEKNSKLKYLILRLPGVLGKNGNRNYLSKALIKIKKNKKVLVASPNALFNNCIHTDTISKIIFDFITQRKKKLNNKVFNLASQRPIKIKNVINKISRHFNHSNKIEYIKSEKKPFLVDISKIQTIYNSLPTTSKCVNKFINSNK